MRFTAQLLATLLALVAVGQVQVFGWVKSYWCPCNPEVPAMLTARCDATVCHPHAPHAESSDQTSDAHPYSDHGHLALTDSGSATPPSVGTDRLLTPLWVWSWEIDPLELPSARHHWELPPLPPPESPPASLLGTYSTVILV